MGSEVIKNIISSRKLLNICSSSALGMGSFLAKSIPENSLCVSVLGTAIKSNISLTFKRRPNENEINDLCSEIYIKKRNLSELSSDSNDTFNQIIISIDKYIDNIFVNYKLLVNQQLYTLIKLKFNILTNGIPPGVGIMIFIP